MNTVLFRNIKKIVEIRISYLYFWETKNLATLLFQTLLDYFFAPLITKSTPQRAIFESALTNSLNRFYVILRTNDDWYLLGALQLFVTK
nr:hypothetical protein A5881_000641 [Enterococcus termitis]